MSYDVGDRVVYPHHGAAVIERREMREAFGTETEYLVLRMAHGDMTVAVPADKLDRLLPNHAWNREEERLVQFDAPYEETQMFSGGGGLVSSTMDYLRFSEMVRRGGELDGVRILSPKTVEFMTANHLPSTVRGAGSGENPLSGAETRGFGFGLGFGVNTNAVGSGVLGSLGEYSWGGAAGTVFWVDPVEEMVVIGMIQLMGSPWPLRGELKVLANQAITESHSN